MSRGDEKAKRWSVWRFSLRSLLLLMLLVATFFGGWKASDWYRDREAMRGNQFLRMLQKTDRDFRSAARQYELETREGKFRVLDIDGLIRAKEAMNRPHDRLTVAQLKAIKERYGRGS